MEDFSKYLFKKEVPVAEHITMVLTPETQQRIDDAIDRENFLQ